MWNSFLNFVGISNKPPSDEAKKREALDHEFAIALAKDYELPSPDSASEEESIKLATEISLRASHSTREEPKRNLTDCKEVLTYAGSLIGLNELSFETFIVDNFATFSEECHISYSNLQKVNLGEFSEYFFQLTDLQRENIKRYLQSEYNNKSSTPVNKLQSIISLLTSPDITLEIATSFIQKEEDKPLLSSPDVPTATSVPLPTEDTKPAIDLPSLPVEEEKPSPEELRRLRLVRFETASQESKRKLPQDDASNDNDNDNDTGLQASKKPKSK